MSLGFIASCDHPDQRSDDPDMCFCGSLDGSPPSHILANGNKSGENNAGLSLTLLPAFLCYYVTFWTHLSDLFLFDSVFFFNFLIDGEHIT